MNSNSGSDTVGKRCTSWRTSTGSRVNWITTTSRRPPFSTRNAGNTFTALNFTGSAAAQFFLGVGAYNARFNRQAMPVKDSEKAAYFQDNFKVNSRLTLNFGVR